MSIFGGRTLQDLRDLWEAQPLYTTYTEPVCVTYTGQPPSESDPLEPEPAPIVPVALGWICGGCGQGYAPGVEMCRYCVPRSVSSNRFTLRAFTAELD